VKFYTFRLKYNSNVGLIQFHKGRGPFTPDCGEDQVTFTIHKITEQNLIDLYTSCKIKEFIKACKESHMDEYLKNRMKASDNNSKKEDKFESVSDYSLFNSLRREIPKY
jgi:hypothetical protein